MSMTSKLAIQLSLFLLLDLLQNTCRFLPILNFIGILLFYCLQTVESNKENENNRNVKNILHECNTRIKTKLLTKV